MARMPADEGLQLIFETHKPTNVRPYYLDMSALLTIAFNEAAGFHFIISLFGGVIEEIIIIVKKSLKISEEIY